MQRTLPPRRPVRPLVLMMDPDLDTRAMYAFALSGIGFDVVPVADGEHAWTRAWQMKPDVIVTDLPLKESERWTLLRMLRQDPRTCDIPVVVVTGHATMSVRDRAVREGCAAFYTKPCMPDRLAVTLRTVLAEQAVDNRVARG